MTEISKEWYVVNTYAGHENKVKENLEKRLETMGISDNLFRILVAEEVEIEYDKKGKKKEKTHNLYPGYLFPVGSLSQLAEDSDIHIWGCARLRGVLVDQREARRPNGATVLPCALPAPNDPV